MHLIDIEPFSGIEGNVNMTWEMLPLLTQVNVALSTYDAGDSSSDFSLLHSLTVTSFPSFCQFLYIPPLIYTSSTTTVQLLS